MNPNAATLTLARSVSQSSPAMVMTVTGATNMTQQVFRLWRNAAGQDTFEGICLLSELSSLLATPPTLGTSGRYRGSAAVVTATDIPTLNNAWQTILATGTALVASINALNTVQPIETVTLGGQA